MPHLPFGMALFGGVDGTAKLEDGEALKSTLFSFDKLDPSKYISSQYNYTDFSGATVSVTFDVPPNVDFQWSTSSEVFTVVGESKSEYQKNLSQNFGLSGFASGFGAEVNVSFGEQTFEETYKSYASCYERTIIYRLKIGHADEVRQWLSSTALDLFASGNADHIVEHLGTHYMKSAAFGGLQRASASIDIRDSGITTDLSTAIKLSADLGDKGGSVDAGDKTETATKLHNSFGNTAVTRMGGTSTNDVALWKASINTQPTPVGYELGTLDELITDPTVAAAVKQKIQDVMNEYPVIGSSAVATYFPLSNTVTDSGSGSHSSITCINMAHLQGWYSLGQFALPNYGEDIGQMAGLMVKEGTTVPGQPRAFTDATGLDRKWGMGDPHHLCVANLTAPENYVSISGVFKNGDDWPRAGDWDRLVCVHKDFIKEAVYGDCLWNDHGTGASDCGSIWAITPKPEDENDQKMVKITGNFDKEPRYFKANSGYDKPSDTAYLPNLARIKVLSNSWVADLKA